MIIQIKQILMESGINPDIILEISALKARQMSLSAGIVPDHNTNWKGALKKVRGTRGELTTGKELSNIKHRMGLPSNNILQKLKSAENKAPNGHEVAYSQMGKNIINGQYRRVDIAPLDMEATNKYQVGFIHTHPYMDKPTKKEYNKPNLDMPSGLINIDNYNKRFSGREMENGHHDFKIYGNHQKTKFPVYAPSENTVSVSRIFLKKPNPIYNTRDKQLEQKYKDTILPIQRKMDRIYKVANNTTDDNKHDKYMDKWVNLHDSKPEKPKLYKDDRYKLNYTRFIVGENNYDNFNLNGERIKGLK